MKKIMLYVFYMFILGILICPLFSVAQDMGKESSKEDDLGEWWLRNPLSYEKMPEQFLYHFEAVYDNTRETGNVITDNHSVSTSLTLRKKIFTYIIRYTFDKQNYSKRDDPPKQNKDVLIRQSTKHEIHNDVRVALTDKLFFSPGMFWLEDDYAQIKDRYTYYSGFGLSLDPHPRLLMNIFAAYAYEELDYIDDYHDIYKIIEDWGKADDIEDYDPDTKESNMIYLYHDVRFYLSRSVALKESLKYFSDYEQGSKYRWNFSIGADIMLSKNIMTMITYNEDYDNAPETLMGLRKRDISIGTGIMFRF